MAERKSMVVRATCDRCGDVSIASIFCSVSVMDGRHTVTFVCPGCTERVVVPVTPDIARAMVDAGAELFGGRFSCAAPICQADLDEFLSWLALDIDISGIARAESEDL